MGTDWVGGGGASLDAFLFVFDGHSEALLQQRQLADQIRDGVGERFLSTKQWRHFMSTDPSPISPSIKPNITQEDQRRYDVRQCEL